MRNITHRKMFQSRAELINEELMFLGPAQMSLATNFVRRSVGPSGMYVWMVYVSNRGLG